MPVLDSYEPGCRLVCRADANPSPDYRWKDQETSSIVDGSEITIVKNVKEHDTEYLYVCVAENSVRGNKLSATTGFIVKIKGMETFEYMRNTIHDFVWQSINTYHFIILYYKDMKLDYFY